jgi:hypothetical protein
MAKEDVRKKVDQLRTDVEYVDQAEVILANPDDFASEVDAGLEKTAVVLEGIDNPAIHDKYLPKIEDKVRGFLKDVDPENYDALTDQLVADLDEIVGDADVDRRVDVRKKERVQEMMRDAESASEKAEQIDAFKIDDDSFDVTTPSGIVSAFDRLCVLEQSVAETGQQMAVAFQDAYSKVEKANDYAADAGVVDYLKTWIPGTKSNPHAADAQSAVDSTKQVFSEKMGQFDQAKTKVENKSKALLSASEKLLQKTTSDAVALESEKGKASLVVPEIERQHKKAEDQIDTLTTGKGNLETNLQKVIGEYVKQIAELREKIDEMEAKKKEALEQKARHEEAREKFLREKSEKYDIANDEQKAVLDAEENRLTDISTELDEGLVQIDSDIASLHESLGALEAKKVEAEDQYDEGISETASMIDEVSEAKEQISDQEIDARAAKELLDESAAEKKTVKKGMGEVTTGIRESSEQWRQSNNEMHETLVQQSVLLENVHLDEPKFFRNFVYNIPIVGKYGVLGAVGGIGKGLSWLSSKIWTDNVEEGYQENLELVKKVFGVGLFAGVFDGAKNIVSGLGHVLAHPEQALDGINLILNPWNWVTEGRQILNVGKAIIQYEEIFEKGNKQFGFGRVVPDILLIFGTGGAGVGGKVATMGGNIANAFSKARAATAGGRILGRTAGVVRGTGSAVAQIGKEAVGITYHSAKLMGKITWGAMTSPKYVSRLAKGLVSKMTAKEILVFMKHGKNELAQRVATTNGEIAKLKKLAEKFEDTKKGLTGDALAQAEAQHAALLEEIISIEKAAAYTKEILSKSGGVKESVFTRVGRKFTKLGDEVRNFRSSWVEKDLAWVDSEMAKVKELIKDEAGLSPKSLKMQEAHKARLKGLEELQSVRLSRLRDLKLKPLKRQYTELLDMKKSLTEAKAKGANVVDDMVLVDAKMIEVAAEMKKLGVNVKAEVAAEAAAAAEAKVAEVAAETKAAEVAAGTVTREIVLSEAPALTVTGWGPFKKYRNAAGDVVTLKPVKWRSIKKKGRFKKLDSSYKGKVLEGSDGNFYTRDGYRKISADKVTKAVAPEATALEVLTEEAGGIVTNAQGDLVTLKPQKATADAKSVEHFLDEASGKRYVRKGDGYVELKESAPKVTAEATATETVVAPEVTATEETIRAAKTDFEISALRDRLKTPLARPKKGHFETMGEYSRHIAEIQEWKLKVVDEMRTAEAERLAVLKERYMDLVNLEREFYTQGGAEVARSMVGKRRGNISPELRESFVKTIDSTLDGVLDAKVMEVIRDPKFASIIAENPAAFRGALRTVANDWHFIPPDFQYVLVAKDMNIAQRVMALCAMMPELYPMIKAMPHYAKADAVERYFRAAAATASGVSVEDIAKAA